LSFHPIKLVGKKYRTVIGPYPVCLFFFTLRDEQAFFSWLAEPVVTDGAPKLVHHDRANCAELTDELMDRVVDRIVAWYDAVEALLIA
jgi:hypothetical protein